MASGNVPDYYTLLNVPTSATPEEIRNAYKRQSLLSHPDRFPKATPTERERLTKKFQSLADAYYVLSDAGRRQEYDALRSASGGFRSYGEGMEGQEQQGSADFFASFFKNAFNAAGAAGAGASGSGGRKAENSAGSEDDDAAFGDERTESGQPQANGVFGNVFEEMLRPEVHRVAPIWKWVGGASGAGLGFILANIPGALAGAFAGSKLGQMRDAKGKSVASVFMDLNQGQRAEVLKALATKVLGSIG